MSEESKKSLAPYFIIGAIVVVVILAVVLWPGEPEPKPVIVVPDTPVIEPIIEEQPESTYLEVVEELADSDITEAEPEFIPPPEPLDTSDGTVKTKLLSLTDYDAFARLLINEALLERFVIMTNTLAEDPASYKRYAPYVEVFESLETGSLLQLYQEYKPAINNIFAEIGRPLGSFDEKLKDAIDVLLDTPEVPVPVEVFTDSVMYKFADSQLESLTAPQKQLLRTGPENMRRIKAKLREIKETL
jgi:hypothetical protein